MNRCSNCAYWRGIWTMRGFLWEANLVRTGGLVRERDEQRSRRRRP